MNRSPKRLLLVLALTGAGAAGATSLGTYDALYPTNPCQDGWAACLVAGQELNAEPLTDKVGRPLPASARVGWFDLKPTPAFSPFTSLSEYPVDGELPPKVGDAPAVADASGDMAAEIARIEEERKRIKAERQESQESVQARQEAAKKAQEDAEKLARAQEEQRRKDDAARKAREAEEATALADARNRSAEEAAKLEAEQAAARAREEADRKKREEEARKQREEADRKAKAEADSLAAEQAAAEKAEAERKKREEEARKAEEEAAQAAKEAAVAAEERRKADEEAAARKAEEDARRKEEQAAADQDCSDLVAMESGALMGKLREGQVGCLEAAYAGAASQTDKNKVSRVLMVNAEASGDRASWEQLVRRHLEEVDRSDPDLCFSYALYLSKGGAGRAWGVIKWSDYALENKSRWTGSTYKSRVYSLMQLKAEAAAALWEYSAQAVVAGEGDRAQLQEEEKKLRGMAKDYAREWLDYARASAQEDRKAMALCVSAAGSKKFCE